MTEKLLRHIGRITNTGSDVVVVFNEIPDRTDHALVVVPSALPPKYSDSLVDLVNTEAQQTHDIATLLSRRIFPTGERMLEALHNNGHLRAVPIEDITMLVTKHKTMPLAEIVEAIRQQKAGFTEPQNLKPVADNLAPPPMDETVPAPTPELSAEDQARNLMMQADLMEADVKNLRDQAYNLDSSLRPKKRGRPKKNPD